MQGGDLRPLKVLLPGTGPRFQCGGLAVELQLAATARMLAPTQVVTYGQRQPDAPFLDDLLRQEPASLRRPASLWLVSWGFHVPRLLRRLRGRAIAYHAHSSGYGFHLPPGVPVLAVSRNTMAYWGAQAPRNPLFLLPNALSPAFHNHGGTRDLDVLAQRRKTSAYVLHTLVPALRKRGLRVHVQEGWVDHLEGLFNRSKVYLYDSADHWNQAGVSEGFGLPPLEALACGCVVFSSLNHALADHLTPGVNCFQIGAGTLATDVERIWSICRMETPPSLGSASPASAVRGNQQGRQLGQVLQEVNAHWDRLATGERPLQPTPGPWPLAVRWKRWLRRWR
ncbi:MAG: glycosyltransferase [Candidatus Synechococcus spongiarum 142]|uniref:Glycosyltransferase n=1 Tax=Candidatus Synechococcus spongiarum 142 TaxID=1608213 RepID=A0A6N3X360_9SYNE|nr:MAG: glycosyltransferase [Candidatus Synechococcus spongiarum 142]